MFTPYDLKPLEEPQVSFVDLVKVLDNDFKKWVALDWATKHNRDQIYLMFPTVNTTNGLPDKATGVDIGKALVKYSEQVRKYYLDLGWVKVEIKTEILPNIRNEVVYLILCKVD